MISPLQTFIVNVKIAKNQNKMTLFMGKLTLQTKMAIAFATSANSEIGKRSSDMLHQGVIGILNDFT